ncbi:hypothetical protein D3C76_809730 [compost metagenome]
MAALALEKPMAAQQGSPNWHWQQLGYSVERGPRHSRTIRRPDGSVVDITPHHDEDRHDAEIRAALAERGRLPHGAAECQAAQKDLFA